jgi:acyl-CoA thioester hydrolase
MDYQFFHSYPLQIRFNDIDVLGHTTNSVYQQYFDLGRLQYFNDVLQERMDFRKEGLILANITVNYLSPIKLYDSIEVRTKVISLGNKSLEMLQQIYNLTSQSVAAESKGIMVGFCGDENVTIPIPQRWKKSFSEFERDIVFKL